MHEHSEKLSIPFLVFPCYIFFQKQMKLVIVSFNTERKEINIFVPKCIHCQFINKILDGKQIVDKLYRKGIEYFPFFLLLAMPINELIKFTDTLY